MTTEILAWLKRRPQRWAHLDQVPFSQLAVLLVAVFSLFSIVGFYTDIMSGGQQPYGVVLATAAFSGLNASLWIVVLARTPMFGIVALAVFQFLSGNATIYLQRWLRETYHLSPIEPRTGIPFAATCILVAVIVSYVCFVSFIRSTGRESFRLRNELELAHSIQKTLVPTISRTTQTFEIFGVSEPSEKVGGDLVDVVELGGGDAVAYVADIAGHGLQAGILMGMLKTSTRTVLSMAGGIEQGAVLSTLMEKLNHVLPQVKESHMYATFTALRLNINGPSFYGMAGSPPLLHWRAATSTIAGIQDEQFPLGLFPAVKFPAHPLTIDSGDILLIATDGIYEVSSKNDAEFGAEGLEKLLADGARLPLAELASVILQTVRAYGKQLDDQTMLLVRRNIV